MASLAMCSSPPTWRAPMRETWRDAVSVRLDGSCRPSTAAFLQHHLWEGGGGTTHRRGAGLLASPLTSEIPSQVSSNIFHLSNAPAERRFVQTKMSRHGTQQSFLIMLLIGVNVFCNGESV